MFHIIQDAYCITRNKRGIYKQAKVYQYKAGLYVGVSGGYSRLCKDGDIGTPDLSYVELVLPNHLSVSHDSLRRLTLTPGVQCG